MQSVTADNYSVLIIAVVMTLVIGFYLYKTKSGLAFRSVGEFPRAAETLGINITKKNISHVLLMVPFVVLPVHILQPYIYHLM